MNTTRRSYSDESGDFRTVADFFVRHAAYLHATSSWNLARFIDWKYGLYDHRIATAGFWQNNAQLWFDGLDRLAGVSICEDGGTEFAIVTAPGFRFLYGEMLDWVTTTWVRENRHETEMLSPQSYEIDVLERDGFAKDAGFCTVVFDLAHDLPPESPLDEGYIIVDMKSCPEYAEQRVMRSAALDGRVDLSDDDIRFQLEFYNNTHNAPTYHPETDLVVKTEDGTHAAGCEALIDPWNCTAVIERVCTRDEHRRKGLARAVILECLHRLQRLGMRSASITGYSEAAIGLYTSLGAHEVLEGHRFSRKSRHDESVV